MNKKILLTISLISCVAMASYVTAFSPLLNGLKTKPESASAIKQNQKENNQSQTNELPSTEDFKQWLKSNENIPISEKNLVYGMMENNESKSIKYFTSACSEGDDRGCFQLALNEIGEKNPEGLDRLLKIALHSKNKELGRNSAQFLGAFILDFAPKNKSALSQSIDAIMPYAANENDANSQFLAANLLLANGYSNDADSMLNKACNNPAANEKIQGFCKNGTIVDKLDQNGKSIQPTQPTQPPVSSCPLKY